MHGGWCGREGGGGAGIVVSSCRGVGSQKRERGGEGLVLVLGFDIRVVFGAGHL